MNRHLISMTYMDSEADKADDLRIELENKDGIWLEWFKKPPPLPQTVTPASGAGIKQGDIVWFKGGEHYNTSMDVTPVGGIRTAGPAWVQNVNPTGRQQYALIGGAHERGRQNGATGDSNVYGWVHEEQLTINNGQLTINENVQSSANGLKGMNISAVIIQRNWYGDGKDRVMDCGSFEIDDLGSNGGADRGSTVTLNCTSLPNSSTVQTQKKSRAWENIKLSAIAKEIAAKNNMDCMFISDFDPVYERREQVLESDISFLSRLCYNAGISLKVTSGIIVLFDAAEFEKKPAVRKIERGKADVKSWRFNASTNDANYSRCRVSYTNPITGITIEYTYTPRDSDPGGITLEINEKVNSRNEARNLAMRRLRQKNKEAFSAAFTLVGDVSLYAGVCVEVIGWGYFDGKYIISRNTSNITGSGYTAQLMLRRAEDEE
ncbi:MAG: contractile injection system protein, VgrG/Pvc8 family [Oscillospiraceae bacterium]|nr:contractile injection system protein, VgrG/Pvc8 family [Oscillospiraceae bacterium]